MAQAIYITSPELLGSSEPLLEVEQLVIASPNISTLDRIVTRCWPAITEVVGRSLELSRTIQHIGDKALELAQNVGRTTKL